MVVRAEQRLGPLGVFMSKVGMAAEVLEMFRDQHTRRRNRVEIRAGEVVEEREAPTLEGNLAKLIRAAAGEERVPITLHQPSAERPAALGVVLILS